MRGANATAPIRRIRMLPSITHARCAESVSARRPRPCSNRPRSRIRSIPACSAPMAARWPTPATTSRRSRCSTARTRPTSPTGAFCRCRARCSTRWAGTRTPSATTRPRCGSCPTSRRCCPISGCPTRCPRICCRPKRRCGAPPRRRVPMPRVRQNLALVVGLQGRFQRGRDDRAGRPAAGRGSRQCRLSAADAGAAERLEAARPAGGQGQRQLIEPIVARRLVTGARPATLLNSSRSSA